MTTMATVLRELFPELVSPVSLLLVPEFDVLVEVTIPGMEKRGEFGLPSSPVDSSSAAVVCAPPFVAVASSKTSSEVVPHANE